MCRPPERVLIVALSGRALAYLARRAWLPATVLDIFGDADTRGYAVRWGGVGDLQDGFDRQRLLQTAARLCPPKRGSALIYGAGFEACPSLLAELADGRELLGNTPEVLSTCVSPQRFFPLLDRLALPYPATHEQCPTDTDGWLAKRAGASGGGHVVPAGRVVDTRGYYFQRRVDGRVVSVLFLADGRKAHLIGFNAQLVAASAEQPYRYGGAVAGLALSVALRGELLAAATALTDALGLRGINGLDAIVAGDRFQVLELNARPTATAELYAEAGGEQALLELHIRACRGEPPPAPLRQRGSHCAHRVVYTRQQVVVPAGFSWPPWCSDRPLAATAIGRDEPLCTVHARAAGQAGVRALLEQRYRSIQALLGAQEPGGPVPV
jgi:predicted ATP-grasp superfamily ATP-dependent carboligase